MSEIVMVHGIGQEQESADLLEASWLPALAGGLRGAQHPRVANQVWRDGRPGEIECRMVYYGDLFLKPGKMGGTGDFSDLSPQQRELAEALGVEWLQRAEERAALQEDRDQAYRQLHALDETAEGRQGWQAAGRPVLQGLSRLRWFAPGAMWFAQTFVERALSQVTRYLTEDDLRAEVQSRIAGLTGPETVAIIGHSLGSVAAFQSAQRLTRELPLLLTLGSPLGLRTVVYDRLTDARTVPPTTRRWVNLADRDDLVAAAPDLTPLFADPYGALRCDWTLDNGAEPHRVESYLGKQAVGEAVSEALA